MTPAPYRAGRGRFAAGPWLAVLWLLAGPSAALAENDQQTLRHFKTVLWPQAYRTQDVALLDQLLHESFQLIDNEGGRSDKQGELKWVAGNAWNPAGFEYRIERLDVYDGRWAVIDGQGVTDTYSYRSSNVLIKTDGRWQAVASHVSGYQEKSSP